ATKPIALTPDGTSSVRRRPHRRTDAGQGGLPQTAAIPQFPEQPQHEDNQGDVHDDQRVALDDGDVEQNQRGKREEVDHRQRADSGGVYFTYWYSARKYQSERIGRGVRVGSARRPLSAGRMMEITISMIRKSVRGNSDMLIRLRRVR